MAPAQAEVIEHEHYADTETFTHSDCGFPVVEGKQVVFVRNAEGFETREVALGREDANGHEVIFGLDAGTEIAVGNTFSLRAELSKSEAGHAH